QAARISPRPVAMRRAGAPALDPGEPVSSGAAGGVFEGLAGVWFMSRDYRPLPRRGVTSKVYGRSPAAANVQLPEGMTTRPGTRQHRTLDGDRASIAMALAPATVCLPAP